MALHDVKEILDELERLYGNEARPASDFCYEEPLDDLILTILSQNTNDKLRDKAFANMKARYSSWEEVAHADIEELKDVLRIAGMSGTKPPRIQQILAAVKDKFGVYSIEELRGWTQPEVRAYLTSLPGVGPSTSTFRASRSTRTSRASASASAGPRRSCRPIKFRKFSKPSCRRNASAADI